MKFKLAIVVILVGIGAFYWSRTYKLSKINSFESCAAAGFPILESYPEQCRTPDGKSFAKDIGNELEYIDQIIVSNPRPNQIVSSPLTISGQARGSWFFEANFPIKIIDESGDELGIAIATAEGEWMTEEFVPFAAELDFVTPESGNVILVIENANPSGLPENQKQLMIPLVVK